MMAQFFFYVLKNLYILICDWFQVLPHCRISHNLVNAVHSWYCNRNVWIIQYILYGKFPFTNRSSRYGLHAYDSDILLCSLVKYRFALIFYIVVRKLYGFEFIHLKGFHQNICAMASYSNMSYFPIAFCFLKSLVSSVISHYCLKLNKISDIMELVKIDVIGSKHFKACFHFSFH